MITTHTGTAPAAVRRSPARWLAALIIPIGPAAVALLRYVLPYNTTDSEATMVEKILLDPGRQSLVLWLGFLAIITLVPGAVWVGRLVSPGAPRLTAVALVLLVPGYLALPWTATSDLIMWMGAHSGMDAGTLTRLSGAIHPTVDVAGLLFVAGHVLGTVLLGLAMWVGKTVPRWAAVLTMISQPLHVVAAVIVVSHPLDLAAWGLQAIAFAVAAYGFALGSRSSTTIPSANR